MISFPDINPEIFRIGPFAVRWYGVMYLMGFTSSWFLVRHQIKKQKISINADQLSSLYTYLIFGLLAGARLGYVLFYNLSFYLTSPLDIFAVWQGGLSFHGGLIGSILAGLFFCNKNKWNPWMVADLIMVTAPVGLGLGRIGNFINGELYGRISDVPWAMVFPDAGGHPRHPSQLYEFLLEGVVLFILLWTLKNRKFPYGFISAFFLIGYAAFRFLVEFFREPDVQLGFVLGPFTMGQVLSIAMMLAGFYIIHNRKDTQR